MMIGGVFLPIEMFWFGWTSSPHIVWVLEVFSGAFLGAGVLFIFLQVSFHSCVEEKSKVLTMNRA